MSRKLPFANFSNQLASVMYCYMSYWVQVGPTCIFNVISPRKINACVQVSMPENKGRSDGVFLKVKSNVMAPKIACFNQKLSRIFKNFQVGAKT